jgi:hypothetical protein
MSVNFWVWLADHIAGHDAANLQQIPILLLRTCIVPALFSRAAEYVVQNDLQRSAASGEQKERPPVVLLTKSSADLAGNSTEARVTRCRPWELSMFGFLQNAVFLAQRRLGGAIGRRCFLAPFVQKRRRKDCMSVGR